MLVSEVLQSIAPAAAFTAKKTSNLDTLKRLCFRSNIVSGYNGQTGYATTFKSDLNCTIDAEKLVMLLSSLSKNAEISLKSLKDSVRVKCKGTTATLGTGSVDVYPDLIPSSYTDIGYAEDLPDAIDVCASMIGLTRNQFPGVAISGRYVYSTDGTRATRVQMSSSVAGGNYYLPLSSAKSLTGLRRPTTMIKFKNLIGAVFSDPMALWFSALLNGEFPYQAINSFFDRSFENQVTLPEGIRSSLQRLSMMIDDYSDGVLVEASGGFLTMQVENKLQGELIEQYDWDDREFSFRVDPLKFREALRISHSVDLSDPHKIVFVGDGKLHALMLR